MKWITDVRMRRIQAVDEIVGDPRYGVVTSSHYGVSRWYKVAGKGNRRLNDNEVFDRADKALECLLEQLDIRLYDMREKFEKLRVEYDVLEAALNKLKAAQ